MPEKVAVRARPPKPALPLMKTGVPGLDEVLGGGLPELSFNLIAGGPGAGKTTLAMQVMFANATAAHPGLFITLLGETSLKMLRYQQQLSFFDAGRVGTDVHFLNLSEPVLTGDLDRVLEQIVEEVGRLHPGIVVIDSFRTLVRTNMAEATPDLALEHFVQRLALYLTTWETTSFLVGEYTEQELRNPVFTVADGIFWLFQEVNRNSVVRKLQVMKVRGMATMPGLHTVRMTDHGTQVFPRIRARPTDAPNLGQIRLSTGVAELDDMMGGGIPAGDSVVLAGPTGSGKTTFATLFAAAGLRRGESAVVVVFEEHPDAFLRHSTATGIDFPAAVREGKLRILYLRPLDLSVDETLEEIRESVKEIGATRVVIDSISGFEVALAPTFRADFRESLYRLIGTLTGMGITIYSTIEVVGSDQELQLTGYQVSFLTDDIISQRFVEIEGKLRTVLTIVKMRGSDHSHDFRAYEISNEGVLLRDMLRDYDGILSGSPTRQLRARPALHAGLTEQEVIVLDALIRSGTTSARVLEGQMRQPPGNIRGMLERLVELEYASRTTADGEQQYRALAQVTDG